MSELQVEILAPAKVITKINASQLQLPGIEGELGILPGHTTFVSELGTGEMTVMGSSNESFFVAGGYIEVSNDKIKVLVDVCERASNIDKDRAEKAKKRALDRLSAKVDVDLIRAQASFLRAETRLSLIGR
jgi:F-type H+-transporting ATPase subunit epsilon